MVVYECSQFDMFTQVYRTFILYYCSYTISWLKETVRWILPLHQIREHGDSMHINGIMITKPFISQGNFKRLRGPVGMAHDVHVGYIFLNSNEEIVVRNPKSKIFFLL